MKKRLALLVLAFSTISLVSCGGKPTSSTSSTTSIGSNTPASDVIQSHTVTFYNGDKVLKTETVKDGEKVESYTPTVDGLTFTGWYATPTLTHTFDFTKAITADTSIFGSFTSYQEDTRTWSIVGSGKSKLLSSSGWGSTITEEHKLTKTESTTANIYTITLDLEKGDQFQFAIDKDWNNQRGYGYLVDGTKDGVTYLSNAGGLASEVRKSNISCEISGNYTFTLTTYPAQDYYDTNDAAYTDASKEKFNYSNVDRITYVRNGDVKEEAEEVAYDFYIKGNKVTGWANKIEDAYKMTEDNGEYKITIQLDKDDEFMFYSYDPDKEQAGSDYIKGTVLDADNSTENISAKPNGNLTVTANGTYSFTYNKANDKLVVTYSEEYEGNEYVPATTWYILGNGSTGAMKANNWGAMDGEGYSVDNFTFTKAEDLKYTLTIDLNKGDQFQICSTTSWADKHGYSSIVDPVKDTVEYFKDGANTIVNVTGTYTFTLTLDATDPSKDAITFTCVPGEEAEYVPATTWYILGNGIEGAMKANNWGAMDGEGYSADNFTFTKAEDLKYTLTIDLNKGDEFQICSSKSWNDKHGFSSIVNPTVSDVTYFSAGGNVTVEVTGRYTFTLNLDAEDPANDTVTFEYAAITE